MAMTVSGKLTIVINHVSKSWDDPPSGKGAGRPPQPLQVAKVPGKQVALRIRKPLNPVPILRTPKHPCKKQVHSPLHGGSNDS